MYLQVQVSCVPRQLDADENDAGRVGRLGHGDRAHYTYQVGREVHFDQIVSQIGAHTHTHTLCSELLFHIKRLAQTLKVM